MIGIDNKIIYNRAINNFVDEFILYYRTDITTSGHRASGNLQRNIYKVLKFDGRYLEISLDVPKYQAYLDNGTNPHLPPVSAIEEWIIVKQIVPRPDINGKIPTPRQLAWAIAKNMAKVGTPSQSGIKINPPHLLDRALTTFGFEDRVTEVVQQAVVDTVLKTIKDNQIELKII